MVVTPTVDENVKRGRGAERQLRQAEGENL
jgi:hypothetical protein